jgi:hypothetical protein
MPDGSSTVRGLSTPDSAQFLRFVIRRTRAYLLKSKMRRSDAMNGLSSGPLMYSWMYT